LEGFGFVFIVVGDVIIMVGLGTFGPGCQHQEPIFFSGN